MNMNMNFMNGMFGKLKPGMCRMSIDGKIAVKTNSGYKTYDISTGQLMNCDNFVFDIGEEFFFMLPTNKVQPGDIIVMAGKPHCVIKEEGNLITALRYEDSTISTVVPEHHMFMGKTYFYGKIVSMFGNLANSTPNEMMKYMAMAQVFGGSNTNMQGNMLPVMFLMNGGFDKMFDNMFDAAGIAPAEENKEDN